MDGKSVWIIRAVLMAFLGASASLMSPASAHNTSFAAPVPVPVDSDRFYSVDLRDLAEFSDRSFPEARVLVHAMTRYPRSFFPEGVRFDPRGVGIDASVSCAANSKKRGHKFHLADSVYGIEVTETPMLRADGLLEIPVLALIHAKVGENSRATTQGFFFRKLRVWLSQDRIRVTNVVVEKDIPLGDTRFEMRVGLVDRKAVLTDSVHGIRKVYPLGVGAFDEGVISKSKMTLLTPTFTNAELRPDLAVFDRDDHDYYCGMPFLRISRTDRSRNGGWTAIGFHISQHAELLRGFDSHGCMRMREKDLYELYFILKHQGDASIRLNVALESQAPGDHPYPLSNDRYQTVVDCKNPTKPSIGCTRAYASWERKFGYRSMASQSCRGEDDLTQTRQFRCTPPVSSLHGIDGNLENDWGDGNSFGESVARSTAVSQKRVRRGGRA